MNPHRAYVLVDLANLPVAGSMSPTTTWTDPKSLAARMRFVHELMNRDGSEGGGVQLVISVNIEQ